MKVVLVGAGSAVFGRRMIADVFATEELNGADCTLTLTDVNSDALERMYKLALLIKEHYNSSVKLERTTDRREALMDADYIILSVARRRIELWNQDFEVPYTYGFRQVYGECGGPGALFHALRNIHLIMPICHDIERFCPSALLLNFTNPLSRVTMAINKLTKVMVVGLCHGVDQARQRISMILERPLQDLDILCGGINHFYWVLKIEDRRTREDLYPEFKRRARKNPVLEKKVEGLEGVSPGEALIPSLTKKMLDIFGYFTYPVDSHPGEYLQFAYDLTGPLLNTTKAYLTGKGAKWKEDLDRYIKGEKILDEKITKPSREPAIPIICDIEFNRYSWRPAVNVPNMKGYVENLPRDAIVELSATVDGEGIHPQRIGALPEALAAFTRIQISIQKLIVEAYHKRSKSLLLQALLLDPIVDSIAKAEELLNRMLHLQSEYLPKFE